MERMMRKAAQTDRRFAAGAGEQDRLLRSAGAQGGRLRNTSEQHEVRRVERDGRRRLAGWRVALVLVLSWAAIAARAPAHAGPVPAAQGQDQEEARRQREAGRILDYGRIRRQALQAVPGRVVDQELRRRGSGRYVYRFKILRSDGKVAIVLVDAHTGRILAIRRR